MHGEGEVLGLGGCVPGNWFGMARSVASGFWRVGIGVESGGESCVGIGGGRGHRALVARGPGQHGDAAPAVSGIAVAADTDNTGENVVSHFGDFVFEHFKPAFGNHIQIGGDQPADQAFA